MSTMHRHRQGAPLCRRRDAKARAAAQVKLEQQQQRKEQRQTQNEEHVVGTSTIDAS
jgi:hypothetical protein